VAIAFTTAVAIVLLISLDDLGDLSETTVLLLTAVFLLVNVSALVLRRDEVPHEYFRAPTALLVLGAVVSGVFLLPVVREGWATYLLALWLLLGGAALWLVNWLVMRARSGQRS